MPKTNKNILFVGQIDIGNIRQIFAERTDISCHKCNDVAMALEMIEMKEFDLFFISDKCEKALIGNLCYKIKNNQKDKKVITVFVSDLGKPDYNESISCDYIIGVPVDQEKLLSIVREAIGFSIRKSPRVSAKMTIAIKDNKGNLLSSYAVNLSIGGLYIETEAPLPKGTFLSIDFILPFSEKNIRCTGVVLWVNSPSNDGNKSSPPGMGVQFIDLQPRDYESISKYIEDSTR